MLCSEVGNEDTFADNFINMQRIIFLALDHSTLIRALELLINELELGEVKCTNAMKLYVQPVHAFHTLYVPVTLTHPGMLRL